LDLFPCSYRTASPKLIHHHLIYCLKCVVCNNSMGILDVLELRYESKMQMRVTDARQANRQSEMEGTVVEHT